MTRPLNVDRILAAADYIDPLFLETLRLRGTALAADLGCELLLKIEYLNPIRSFKGRGAELFIKATASAVYLASMVMTMSSASARACERQCRSRASGRQQATALPRGQNGPRPGRPPARGAAGV